jgi:cytochrome c-type biogenesis protein CcmH/NrfF
MSMIVWIFPILLGVVVAWELASRLQRRRDRTGDADPMQSSDTNRHAAPELERRRRLALAASRWPGPSRWG